MKYAVKRVQRHQLFETCLRGWRWRRVASTPFLAIAPWASVDALLVTIIVTIITMASLDPGALRRVDHIGWRVREDATKLRGGLHPTRTLESLSLVLGLTPRWRVRVLSIAAIGYERNTKIGLPRAESPFACANGGKRIAGTYHMYRIDFILRAVEFSLHLYAKTCFTLLTSTDGNLDVT